MAPFANREVGTVVMATRIYAQGYTSQILDQLLEVFPRGIGHGVISCRFRIFETVPACQRLPMRVGMWFKFNPRAISSESQPWSAIVRIIVTVDSSPILKPNGLRPSHRPFLARCRSLA